MIPKRTENDVKKYLRKNTDFCSENIQKGPLKCSKNHKSCVRMEFRCLLLLSFQTRKYRIVILYLLRRMDCPKLNFKNNFKWIFLKITKIDFPHISYIFPILIPHSDRRKTGAIYFLYKSLTPIVR